MSTNTVGLVTLSFLSATLCWLPTIIEPSLDLPSWLPFLCVALSAALSSYMKPQRWRVFLLVSTMGSFVGLCIGFAIWWPRDPIAGPWVPIVVTVSTGVAAILALISGFVGSRMSARDGRTRTTAWIALVIIPAFGLTCLALTRPLVTRRIAINEHHAAERLTSLRRTVERTLGTRADQAQFCDGSLLKRNYSGLPFSDEDWRRITGNYVKQDGYFFMIYCREKAGYVLDVQPARDGQDGRRHFCADESGKIGCGMKLNRSQHVCEPCRGQANF